MYLHLHYDMEMPERTSDWMKKEQREGKKAKAKAKNYERGLLCSKGSLKVHDARQS